MSGVRSRSLVRYGKWSGWRRLGSNGVAAMTWDRTAGVKAAESS